MAETDITKDLNRTPGYKNNHFGFTLAEVLITLGIIGIVAAMTIPTLVSVNNQRAWNTASSVFERKLGEALSVMNTQQSLAGWPTTEAFVNELGKHIKVLKTCDKEELEKCFSEEFFWGFPESELKNLTDFKDSSSIRLLPYGTNNMGVMFASGVNAIVAYNPTCKADPYSNQTVNISSSKDSNNKATVNMGTSCISMLYDVNGFSKPNHSGEDLRAINVNKLWTVKLNGTKYTQASLITPVNCTDTSSSDYQYCTANAKYPNDYYAGAAKTCGGVSNFASQDQLTEIAYYVYGGNGSDTAGRTGRLDQAKKISEFGLPEDGDFSIWESNTLFGNSNGFTRYFNKLYTRRYSKNIGVSDIYVICVVN